MEDKPKNGCGDLFEVVRIRGSWSIDTNTLQRIRATILASETMTTRLKPRSQVEDEDASALKLGAGMFVSSGGF